VNATQSGVSVRWLAQTSEDTEAFGAWLASTRPAGEALAVVYLIGELGAGKTTLARGYLRACGVAGPVRSPTYSLLEIYDTPGLSILHADLFRVQNAAELDGIGLREWARPAFLWLVEWPERGAGHLPQPDLSVGLSAGTAGHEINVTAGTALGVRWLNALSNPALASLVEKPPPGT